MLTKPRYLKRWRRENKYNFPNMIYVLFGPPGVGKTYIGQLLSRSFDLPFFDADTLIDAEEKQLLQNGTYDQKARDRFVSKLIHHVKLLVENHGNVQDLVIAEAFTKEKNRIEFMNEFKDNTCYIMIDTPIEVAKNRAIKRLSSRTHVINNQALELIWTEFERPKLIYVTLNNYHVTDNELLNQFDNLIKLVRRGKA